MENKITEVVFILDASGSMHGLEQDTIGGVNTILEKQKKEQNGDMVYISTVMFNTQSRVIRDRVDLVEVEPMSERDYIVGGGTALYDAVGDAIHHIVNIHKYARKEDIPEKTTFVIMTDGMENASRRYSRLLIKSMIEERQQQGWEFLFLGANIDAKDGARDIGIASERAVDWKAQGESVRTLYDNVNEYVTSSRLRKAYSREIFADTDADFEEKKDK